MLLDDKHIYLVEDDPTNLAVTRTILLKHGATVPILNWVDISLDQIAQYSSPIDLFILDIMFPGKLSGYDVFAALKATPKYQNVPAVIVSASDPDVEIPRAQQMGLSGFISKPINRYRFPHQIHSILNGDAVWDERSNLPFR